VKLSSSKATKRSPIGHISPGLLLFVLAPVLAELLSGHQSPAEFFNPLNLIVLSLPYGCGAVICRELAVRWHKGRLTLLLLGIAYGMYEEGIVVRSIFNPAWGELGNLAEYSHGAGVTWTYAELLIHFHVIVSITASIYLVEMAYPDRRQQSWINNTQLIGCFIYLLLWIPAGFLMTSYIPPAKLYSSAWAAIGVLVLAAHKVPAHILRPRTITVVRPFWFWLLGFLNMSIFFFMVFLTPEYDIVPYFVTALLLIVLEGITGFLVLHWSGNGFSWDDRHRLAFFAGGLSFFICACFAHDMEQWTGLSVVALLAITALWQLNCRVANRLKKT
jgi:hypothetical protein